MSVASAIPSTDRTIPSPSSTASVRSTPANSENGPSRRPSPCSGAIRNRRGRRLRETRRFRWSRRRRSSTACGGGRRRGGGASGAPMLGKARDPSHPPLSCRTSPPHGGRSAARNAVAHSATSKIGESRRCRPISPLEGEMSGRTEGGDVEHQAELRATRPTPRSPAGRAGAPWRSRWRSRSRHRHGA